MSTNEPRGFVNILQEFSVPLIAGVLVALAYANIDYAAYHEIVHWGPFDALCANAEPGGLCVEAHHAPAVDHADGEPTGGEGGEHGAPDGHEASDLHDTDGGADAPGAHGEGARHAMPGDHASGGEGHVPAGDESPDHGTIKPVVGVFGHHLTLHFLINDIFMLFFFGVAAKEITESILPGGALNPPSKAINPLLAMVGGVVGPVAVYLALTTVFYGGTDDLATVSRGWGIPTATDIAIAWLVARVVFGTTHPAVNFLLLLAIADDAIGLVIIAVFYGDPANPARPAFLVLVLAGMAVAWFLRRRGTTSWLPYVALGGTLSWIGLLQAHLHPALALVPVIPFLPGPHRDTGFFSDQDEVDEELMEAERSGIIPTHAEEHHSTLHRFEHDLKLFVDLGLFFFGFANAGVALSSVNAVTWIVLAALLIGKTIGVTAFSVAGRAIGFQYPTGMSARHIVVAGMVAGIGLTVALFVAGEAFPEPQWQGPAKMGALLSAVAALFAFLTGRAMRVSELDRE